MRSLLIVVFILTLGGKVSFTQTNSWISTAPLSDSVKSYVEWGKIGGIMHNHAIGCVIENLDKEGKKLNRENRMQYMMPCLQEAYTILDTVKTDTDISDMNPSTEFGSFAQQLLANLSTYDSDSIKPQDYPSNIASRYVEKLKRIDDKYLARNYETDDTTFIHQACNQLLLELDNDTSLDYEEKRALIFLIQITRYDRLLWTHYKDYKYQFRYEN